MAEDNYKDIEELETEETVDGGTVDDVTVEDEAEQAEPKAEDEEQAPSGRDRHIARMKERYPDLDYEDEEAVWSQIGSDYDDYENQLSGYRENSKKLTDLFDKDPRSAKLVAEMARGNDPVLGLFRYYGPEIRDILDDPDMQEELAQANKDYVERVAKEKEFEETYRGNLDGTIDNVEAVQQETGMSDDEADAVMEYLTGIVADGILGKFSKETIMLARKALNYDSAVADAEEAGMVAGRNQKIREKLRAPEQGDGTIPMDGGGGAGTSGRKRSIFDVAMEAR